MGNALLGSLGVVAGIWAEKFDELAAFQNFFYSTANIFIGSILYGSFIAIVLAKSLLPQSIFLHDRWFSLRLLWHIRDPTPF